jgi:signal transduction histidine kinase
MTTHELRAPLTGIKGNAQLMKRRKAYSGRSIDTIIKETERLERHISDLLLASQIQNDRLALALEDLDLAAAARSAVDSLGREDAGIRLEADGEPVMVHADPHRLSQVLMNLLTNALKYSPEGARVTVRVARTEDEACVSVEDQGVGIPADALPHLFDRFFRVSKTSGGVQGLGLGLYISRRIVDAHGGRIEVRSELGRGSTFTVKLPLPRRSATVAESR